MDPFLSQDKLFNDETCTSTPQKLISYAGNYQLIRQIQRGGQAIIYLATKENSYYALKVYNQGELQDKAFENQARILERLEYKGITPITEATKGVTFKWENEEEKNVHIIAMPFIENGDLFDWIKNHGSLSEKIAKYFGKKLIATFRYLSSQHIFHRDIKPQNILLDENFFPMILDFGLSIDNRSKVNNFVGDIRYASPEVLKRIEYTEKSEMYSFGILLFYVLTGQYPFAYAKVSDPNYRLLHERKYNTFWQRIQSKLKKELSSNFKQVFVKLISPNPIFRPTFDEVLEYSWFCQSQPGQYEYEQYFKNMQQQI